MRFNGSRGQRALSHQVEGNIVPFRGYSKTTRYAGRYLHWTGNLVFVCAAVLVKRDRTSQSTLAHSISRHSMFGLGRPATASMLSFAEHHCYHNGFTARWASCCAQRPTPTSGSSLGVPPSIAHRQSNPALIVPQFLPTKGT